LKRFAGAVAVGILFGVRPSRGSKVQTTKPLEIGQTTSRQQVAAAEDGRIRHFENTP
jgi:hypothetical protein